MIESQDRRPKFEGHTESRSPNSGFAFRPSAAGLCRLLAALSLSPWLCLAQPKAEIRVTPPLNVVEAEKEGGALVAPLLVQRPEQDLTNTGVLSIRAEEKTREIPIRFQVLVTPTNWLSVYEAATNGHGGGPVKLTVVHSDNQPNQYLLSEMADGKWQTADLAGATNSTPVPRRSPPCKTLAGAEILTPFAGSDFWAADLGVEFLHWPTQRLLRKEMRLSRSCNVLESINPQRVAGGYARVVSWMDIESGGILLAEAYDVHDRLLKQFATRKIEKVHGQWQLEGIEMRNRETGSRTRIEFDLK
jgi:hypothetical protein